MPDHLYSEVQRLEKELIAATSGRADVIDAQIAVLEARASEVEYNNPFSARAIDEAAGLRKQVTALEQRRRAILEGNPDPALPPATPSLSRSAPRTLEKPHRTTIRAEKSAAAAPGPPKADEDQKLTRKFNELMKKTDFNDDVSAMEDLFEVYSEQIPGGNVHVKFTRGAYGAFLALHAQHRKEMLAIFKIGADRSKELEAKIELLESSRLAAIEILSRRISELESRPIPKHRGIWRDGKTYPLATMITDRGSLWHAERETAQRPGLGNDWTLVCKRGADGKDARVAVR